MEGLQYLCQNWEYRGNITGLGRSDRVLTFQVDYGHTDWTPIYI